METGKVSYTDQDGAPLPPAIEKEAKRQGKDQVERLLQEKADEINNKLRELERLHLLTPRPDSHLTFQPAEFPEDPPSPPTKKSRGFLGRLIPPIGRKREEDYARQWGEYEKTYQQWESRQQAHEAAEEERRKMFQAALNGETESMEGLLEERLGSLEWPYVLRPE